MNSELNEIVSKVSREIAEKRDAWIMEALMRQNNYSKVRNLHRFIIENNVEIIYNPHTKNSELYMGEEPKKLIGLFKEELSIIKEEEGFRYGIQYWVKKADV